MEPKETVLQTLKQSQKPLKPGEIAELAGLEKSIVEKQIKALKTEGLIESPVRCYYSAK